MTPSAPAQADYFSNRPTAPQQLALSEPASGKSGDETPKSAEFQPFGEDGFTFLDFIDIINPLQHIPVVATLYRELTGDTIDPGSRLGGGALFGGPFGAVASLINVVVNEGTGKDVGEHVLAFFDDQPPSTGEEAPTDVAGAPDFIHEASYDQPAATAAIETAPAIQGDIEVLQWAQREAAYRRDVLVQAGLPVLTSQYSAVKKYDALSVLAQSAALTALDRNY